MIKIVIADDHPIIRTGITHIINEQTDMKVIAKAEDGVEAVEKALDLEPDIVIMDIYMPHKDGLTATKEIIHNNDSIKVIILTTENKDNLSLSAIEAGALGFLLKSDSDEDLLEAVRAVYNGSAFLKPDTTKQLLDNYITTLK